MQIQFLLTAAAHEQMAMLHQQQQQAMRVEMQRRHIQQQVK